MSTESAPSDTNGVVATAECGTCTKPLRQIATYRWVHADGKTYRHIIEPYFIADIATDLGVDQLGEIRKRAEVAEAKLRKIAKLCDDVDEDSVHRVVAPHLVHTAAIRDALSSGRTDV